MGKSASGIAARPLPSDMPPNTGDRIRTHDRATHMAIPSNSHNDTERGLHQCSGYDCPHVAEKSTHATGHARKRRHDSCHTHGCSWLIVLSRGHMSGSCLCSAQDARGRSWMLVISIGSMSDSYMCNAQDARGCSSSPMYPSATPTCASHKNVVDARGCSCSPMAP